MDKVEVTTNKRDVRTFYMPNDKDVLEAYVKVRLNGRDDLQIRTVEA